MVRQAGAARYRTDFVAFAGDVLGIGLASYQAEILGALTSRRRVCVRGPHGLGKSTVAAAAVLAFAATREAARSDWKVVTTAGAWRQLEKYLWPEAHKWRRRLDWTRAGLTPWREGVEALTLSLRPQHGEAFAVASDRAELIEGAHADEILYVLDEGKAIPDATWDAVEGAFSAGEAYALALSTPGPPSGRFYSIHARRPGLEDWWPRHVTLDEAIAAGRVSATWADARRRQWGETSPVYRNRVLGEFAESEDGIIPLSWIEAAVERWLEWRDSGASAGAQTAVGVDVGGGLGGDSTVLARRAGDIVTALEVYPRGDEMATTGRAVAALTGGGVAIVDGIGIGAGVVARLREMGRNVRAFIAGSASSAHDRSGELGFENCLTGDARIRPVGRLIKVYRARYEGALYRVKTARGDDFTATPNHNVLTLGGWVAVKSLNVGDKLCDPARSDGADSPAVRPEEDDVPPMISEVYRAAHDAFGSERMKSRAVDFHGDRPTGEVDVVTLDGNLLAVNPPLGKQGQEGSFVGALVSQGALRRLCSSSAPFGIARWNSWVRTVFPDHGMPRGPLPSLFHGEPVEGEVVCLADVSQGDPVLREHSREGSLVDTKGDAQPLDGLPRKVTANESGLVCHDRTAETGGLGLRAPSDAALGQDAANDVAIDPESLRDRVNRVAGLIPLDEVVSVEKVFHGSAQERAPFVYTMGTSTGAYCTTTVTHRNCRAEAWWGLRERLDPGNASRVALPDDDELVGELAAPSWKPTSRGRVLVESKDEIRRRIGRSTDRADAVVMAFWGGDSALPARASAGAPVTFAPRGPAGAAVFASGRFVVPRRGVR